MVIINSPFPLIIAFLFAGTKNVSYFLNLISFTVPNPLINVIEENDFSSFSITYSFLNSTFLEVKYLQVPIIPSLKVIGTYLL